VLKPSDVYRELTEFRQWGRVKTASGVRYRAYGRTLLNGKGLTWLQVESKRHGRLQALSTLNMMCMSLPALHESIMGSVWMANVNERMGQKTLTIKRYSGIQHDQKDATRPKKEVHGDGLGGEKGPAEKQPQESRPAKGG